MPNADSLEIERIALLILRLTARGRQDTPEYRRALATYKLCAYRGLSRTGAAMYRKPSGRLTTDLQVSLQAWWDKILAPKQGASSR